MEPIRQDERYESPAPASVKWTEALCATGDASLFHLFFSEDEADIQKAKDICTSCPLLRPCFDGALRRREPWGVWGGQLFDRGVPIARKPARGRPRKTVTPAPPIRVEPYDTEVA